MIAGVSARDTAPLWIAALCLAAAGLVHAGARAQLMPRGDEELLYYPSARFTRQAALGYETAGADVAWLRAIQYYGEHRVTDMRFDRIGHVTHVIATLDPLFVEPMIFGSFVLAQEMKQPDEGVALLRRGMEANPESWLLAFEMGFLHYICRHDYETAGRWFTRAARLPGHPEYAERFAAFAYQRAGVTDLSILLWKRVLATGNRYTQEIARREIARLEAIR